MTDDLTLIREVYKLIYFTKPIQAAEIIALVESATRAKIADEIRAMDAGIVNQSYSTTAAFCRDDIADRVARGTDD